MKTTGMLCIALLVAACGGDDEEEGSVDVEGCEHLQEGPEVAITATADQNGAPALADDHMRYDVALIDVAGGKGGVVAFAADQASDFVFFLGAGVPVAITDSAMAEVDIEESATSSPECDDIKGRHLVELAVGTYYLELGPTTETSVSIVVEPVAHEPH